MMTRTEARWTITLALIALLVMAAGPPAARAATSCGDTIAAGSEIILTADDPITTAPCNTSPALTVTGPATVDLNGFKISCTDPTTQNGIMLAGEKAELLNGSVTNCAAGVALTGSGGHKVSSVVSYDNDSYGCYVAGGEKNKLVSNAASGNGIDGFWVAGLGKNTLAANTATGNGDDGFEMDSDGNKLKENVSANNDYGFYVYGTAEKNVLVKNQATGNSTDGFALQADGVKAVKNTAAANGGDGFDHYYANEGNFTNNTAAANGEHGFYVQGNATTSGVGNKLTRNQAMHNLWSGIFLEDATETTVDKNVAVGNNASGGLHYDLEDFDPTCDTNEWSDNKFLTADPTTCIH